MRTIKKTGIHVEEIGPQALDQQAAQVGIGVIVSFCVLSGLFGASCFISALAQHGITRMVMEWGKAIIGA